MTTRAAPLGDETATGRHGGNGAGAASSGTAHEKRTIAPGTSDEGLANAMGWFSIGLGLAQVAAPGAVARFVGVEESPRNLTLMQAFGAREFASGVGLLTQPRPTGWLWARVAGDVLDLTVLGLALRSDDTEKNRVAIAAAAVLGALALDVLGAQRNRERSDGAARAA